MVLLEMFKSVRAGQAKYSSWKRRGPWSPSGSDCSRRCAFEALEERTFLAADMVLEWNDVLLDAIRVDRTAPPIAARNMAIVHVAVYDAVNSIMQTHEPYAAGRSGPRGAAPEAAVAAAAHTTLAALFPSQKPMFDAALRSSLSEVPDGRAENQGIALGQSVAHRILALRRHDGWDDRVAYAPGDEPGGWQATPPSFQAALLPNWPYVTPFAMTSGAQFRPDGPPELASAEYAADFNEVKLLGERNSATRTADQTEIALFWADGPGTATPPGHWNEIAQDVARAQENSLAGNARLFALLNIAVADAGIAAWDAKYAYDIWRPLTGIRQADLDGNAATNADPNWTAMIGTPPFPSYTSGHSTFSSAAATVLASFFGTDAISFTTSSDGLPGASRSFASFSEAADEAGRSRIYGGIHWEFDNADGLAAGRDLARYVVQNFLRAEEASAHTSNSPAPGAFAVEPAMDEVVAIDRPGDRQSEHRIGRKLSKQVNPPAAIRRPLSSEQDSTAQPGREYHFARAVDALFSSIENDDLDASLDAVKKSPGRWR